MREDAVAVYIRHRNELLKAIYDGDDTRHEVGDFLLSMRNLDNHDITFNPLTVDVLCKSYSEIVLKNEEAIDTGSAALGFGQAGSKKGSKYGRANLSRLIPVMGSDHHYVGRIKDSWTDADNVKHGYPLFIPGADENENRIPLSMKHALWPELNSRKAGEYNSFFFDEDTHPLRRRNAVTASPEWRRKLREFYFSDDDSPSLAEQLMAAEKAHEAHHSKMGSEVYKGVYRGKTEKRFTEEELERAGLPPAKGGAVYEIQERNHNFIGRKSGDKESYGSHLHTIRLHDFERWKEQQGAERLAELEEQGKDLELAHFDDRMDELEGHGITDMRYDPKKTLTSEELYNEDPEDLEIQTILHGQGMGWPTWNMGMEFLPPSNRTKVLEHIALHDSDDELKQKIKMPDGSVIPMARIKTNMDKKQPGVRLLEQGLSHPWR